MILVIVCAFITPLEAQCVLVGVAGPWPKNILYIACDSGTSHGGHWVARLGGPAASEGLASGCVWPSMALWCLRLALSLAIETGCWALNMSPPVSIKETSHSNTNKDNNNSDSNSKKNDDDHTIMATIPIPENQQSMTIFIFKTTNDRNRNSSSQNNNKGSLHTEFRESARSSRGCLRSC